MNEINKLGKAIVEAAYIKKTDNRLKAIEYTLGHLYPGHFRRKFLEDQEKLQQKN